MDKTSGLHSVWVAHCENITFPTLDKDIEVDVAIIGGGITGITCAHLLAESGKKVAMLEAWKVGEGTTGYSTGNLYAIVDERLYRVKSKFDKETADKVTQSRSEALSFIENNISRFDIACDYRRVPWYLFTNMENKVSEIEKEGKYYSEAGLDTTLGDKMPIDFPVKKVLQITEQAQFNPLRYVKQYALRLSNMGCMVYENSPVTDIDHETHTLETPHGKIKAKYIVHATHTPKGFAPVQSLLGAYREYGIAVKLAQHNYPPAGIYWHVAEGHHHSFRTYEKDEEQYLVMIGAPNKVGHNSSPEDGFDDLMEFINTHFGPAEVAYNWAGQHYRAADTLPYIGKLTGKDNEYFATGFSTDGLIYGTVAARIIADSINGVPNAYESIYDAHRVKIAASAERFVKENADVAWQYMKDLGMKIFSHPYISDVPGGEGKVVDIESKKWAVYKQADGKTHIVSAVCPHMGCIVNWNPTENSWDCPCHGSRFTVEGDVIEGPAMTCLESLHKQ